MNCPLCSERHWLIRWFLYGTTSTEMRLADWWSDYHDPSQSHGHGQQEGKAWYCRCGHTEEYEPDDPEPPDYEDND